MPFISVQSGFRSRLVPSTCVAERLDPFPYQDHYINVETATSLSGGLDSYYNDPTLDAVQYNVNIGGDPLAWGSTDYDVYYGPGLPPTTYPEGTPVAGAAIEISTDKISTAAWEPSFIIQSPLSDKYCAPGSDLPGPISTGIRAYPGVASNDVWYRGNSWTEVPCFGRPLWFEAWYSENPTKTNPNVLFNGYTIFGDSNTGETGPRIRNGQTVDGYVRKCAYGILKRTANIEMLTTSDIIFGFHFVGTATGGTVSACANGIVQQTLTVSFKPALIWPYTSTAMSNVNYYSLNGLPQTYSWATFWLGTFLEPYLSDQLEFDQIVPLDTFDTKWGWYFDYVPDAGEGTYCGQVTSALPTMHTHPGWPCPYVPPANVTNWRITNWIYHDINDAQA